MKILMINKFLYPKGGSETYMLRLGEYLESISHEVEYFGMDSAERTVGNRAGLYTEAVDLRGESQDLPLYKRAGAVNPLKLVYSREAEEKLSKLLWVFRPDVCHLNNINFQLTPSVILAIMRYRNRGNICPIIMTAHDYQLLCPNHMCRNPALGENCEKCLSGNYFNCMRYKCIHGSLLKSGLGAFEAGFWRTAGIYRHIDKIICCSDFQKGLFDRSPLFREKTVRLHNFAGSCYPGGEEKKDYVLYFGRYDEEKGIKTLLEVCRRLPQVRFFFAGTGLKKIIFPGNVTDLGFLQGRKLEKTIASARFSVFPSEWYENCPFSVMESISLGTPALGARIGGIPELIDEFVTGELFESGNADELTETVKRLWEDRSRVESYSKNCRPDLFDTVASYSRKLMRIYKGEKDG